jgi:hypothetical protein
MRAAIVASIVAMLVSAASATAAFVVTSANIKNGTIQLVDLNGKTKRALKGSRGPRGFEGPEGAPGPQGAPGPAPAYTRAYSERRLVAPGSFGFVNAICPQGAEIVGGGHATEDVSNARLMPSNSYPIAMADGRGAWYVVMHNDGQEYEEFWAVAFCVSR